MFLIQPHEKAEEKINSAEIEQACINVQNYDKVV